MAEHLIVYAFYDTKGTSSDSYTVKKVKDSPVTSRDVTNNFFTVYTKLGDHRVRSEHSLNRGEIFQNFLRDQLVWFT
jgi:hypothetical protein